MTFSSSFDADTGHLTITQGSTRIPAKAFDFRFDIASVSIPDSVTTIGFDAFHKNSLTEVVIPDSVESIGFWSFGSGRIKDLIIGNSVVSIETGAFDDNSLTKLVIPDSVLSIGSFAFTENILTDVTLPAHFEDNPPVEAFDPGVLFSFADPVNQEPDPSSTPETVTEPEPDQNIVESVKGKGRLKGTKSADTFTFDSFDVFRKKGADIISGFDASQGDTIAVSSNAFPALNNVSNIIFASTSNKKKLKQMSRQDIDFIYFEKRGFLYFNGNGSDPKWGNSSEGGLVAVLKGKPDLGVNDLVLLT